MDSETAKYLKRTRSSDGVPNRKGGSWPNHPAMRYELPIPFSPGADQVNEEYRLGYEVTFGPQQDISAKFCQTCDKLHSWCECKKEEP